MASALDNEAIPLEELLPLLSKLKVATRSKAQRIPVGQKYMTLLIHCLRDRGLPCQVVAEAANVLLNLCYEKHNVEMVLQHKGATSLVELLHSADEEVEANAAGALQSICFQPAGRKAIRKLGAISRLVELLSAKSINVRARAAGALHNISSDGEAIREIRKKGGIKPLIRLLHSRQATICGSAAGGLQNLSREVASRAIIRNSDAVLALVHLLASSELQTQVCAAGALLNILGRELDNAKRTSIIRGIKNLILGSIICNNIFTAETRKLFGRIRSLKID